MSAQTAPRDNVDATRTALVAFCARQLSPLFRDGVLRTELGGWLAPLPLERIARALKGAPEATAAALADAILANSASRDPVEAIADIVADEYPSTSHAVRARTIDLAQTLRALAIEQDGVVTGPDLAACGFRSDEQTRLMPQATHVLAVLNGTAPPSRHGGERCASDRLIEAGVRAATRFNVAAHAHA